MNRRDFLGGLGGAALATSAGAAPRPNFVFILADDLGYGDIGCMGQQRIVTPALDRMANEGMLFTQHYAGGPVCGPSRACLMTGRHQGSGYIKGNPPPKPPVFTGHDPDIPLRPQDVTLAEVLRSAGYETALVGKWGLGNRGTTGYPTKKGFEYFIGYDSHVAAHDYYPAALCRNEGELALPKGTYSHDVFTREALEFLGREHERTFFLELAYTIPHTPYDPPDLGPYGGRDWEGDSKKYAAMITRMDRDIGRILDLLRTTGQARNTLVIFASDNGPHGPGIEFFDSNGPLRGIKRDVYDGGIREPFIAWWPGHVSPGVSRHVSAFQDVMPTLAELAGARAPEGIDGISMAPTLLGRAGQRQHDYFYWEFVQPGGKGAGGRQSCLEIATAWKGVRYGSKGALELYDLNRDLGERHDLSKEHPDVVARLTRYLDTVRTPSDIWPMPESGRRPRREDA